MKGLKEFILEANTPQIKDKMYHKANPIDRESIDKHGLLRKVGDSYKMHWEDLKNVKRLRKYVFMYDKEIHEYDTTYDDDIWEIDITKLDNNKIKGDPDRWMWKNKGCWVYADDIPREVIKLVHEGTGESLY